MKDEVQRREIAPSMIPGQYPLADQETAQVRRAALADLRADGMSDEDLREIAELWRREDEILANARASAEALRPTSPIVRARINSERARLEAIEAPIASRVAWELRMECERLLDQAIRPVPWFPWFLRITGAVEDASGREITVTVSGFATFGGARSITTITVRIDGLEEALKLPPNYALLDPSVFQVRVESSPTATTDEGGRKRSRPPTLSEVQGYKDLVFALRHRQ